jgi:hypothetical protein
MKIVKLEEQARTDRMMYIKIDNGFMQPGRIFEDSPPVRKEGDCSLVDFDEKYIDMSNVDKSTNRTTNLELT